METLTLNTDELIMRHEDLTKFISEIASEKKIRIKNLCVRSTGKELDKPRDYKKYNTCIQHERAFSEKSTMYINIDKSFSFTDIYRLAKQYMTFADYKSKQDAFQLGTLAAYHKEMNKDILPGDAFQKGLANFKEMKAMEE